MFLRYSHLLRVATVCLLGCLLFLLVLPARAFAASDPITVTARSDTVAFPKSIDYSLRAIDASSPITQATIFIMSSTGGTDHVITINPPSNTIAIDWHEDTTGNNFMPPGTQVSYYWKLQDSAGNIHNDTQQNFGLVDTRFTWQHLSQGMLQVNWYNQPIDFGQMVFNKASSNVNRISKNLGGGLSHPINLWIYQSTDDFRGSLSPTTHEWVGGIAFPSLDEASVVVESSNDDTLVRDMPHELTHLIFHQLIGQGIDAPIWFDEGLAVYNQLYHEPQMALRLKEALAAHALLRLQDISFNFPADTSQAYLAYAQSWNLVDYMYQTFGRAKMAALIKAMNNPQMDFNQDLARALGVDQNHLENQWRLHLNQPPILSPVQTIPATQTPIHVNVSADTNTSFLIGLGLLLILLPLIGISVVFTYQRRSRQKALMAQQAQQILHSTFPSHYPATHMGQRERYIDSLPHTPPSQPAYRVPQQARGPRQPYPPYPLPNTPGNRQDTGPVYPPVTPNEGRRQVRREPYPPSMQRQEFSSYHPRQGTIQE